MHRDGKVYLRKIPEQLVDMDARSPRQLYHWSKLIEAMTKMYGSKFINGAPPVNFQEKVAAPQIAKENPYPRAPPKGLIKQEEYLSMIGDETRQEMERLKLIPTAVVKEREKKEKSLLITPPTLAPKRRKKSLLEVPPSLR